MRDEFFKQSAEDFLCTAASETERERPDDAFFYDKTADELQVGSLSYYNPIIGTNCVQTEN